MPRGINTAVAAGLGVISMLWTWPASANVTVIGGGFAEDCFKYAKAVSTYGGPRVDAIHLCTLALDQEPLDIHDRASTYVNRGVLYLAASKYVDALRDFNSALEVEPGLGEALVNRGAALIGQGHDTDAIADISRGLTFNPVEPEKAYFNRAIAEERLNDLKAAYYDYRKALELKPSWTMPQTELTRFTVVEK